MNAKYAVFIWSSYALAAAVLLWNLIAPRRRRKELHRLLSSEADFERLGEATDSE